MSYFLRLSTLFLVLSFLGFTNILLAQTADHTEGCAPLNVQFTAPSTSSSFYWEFGDGGSSTLQNPSHIFTTTGNLTVTFKESQAGAVVGTIPITIYSKPTPSFTGDPTSGCVPLEVQFQSTSTVSSGISVTNYNWVFGDGGGTSGQPNPSHVYSTEGNFLVSLQLITDKLGCDTTALFPDFVKTSDAPNPTFITSPFPPTACNPPLNVSFTNTTPAGSYSFDWDFGNGTTYSGSAPPSQNYTTDGIFPVTLTLSTTLGCVKQANLVVGIGSPAPSFNLPNDTLCLYTEYQISNTSPAGSYSWEFQDANPATSDEINPLIIFNSVGEKTIKLTLTSPDGQCSGELVKTFFVEEASVSASASPAYSCSWPVMLNFTASSPNNVSWAYYFSDGTTSNEQNPSHLYVDYDTTTYSLEGSTIDTTILIVTTASGCQASERILVEIYTPNALFLPNVSTGCAPLDVIFEDQSISKEEITTWQWDLGDGTTIDATNGNDIPHTYTQPGVYDVQLIIVNNAGCRDTSYVRTIHVGDAVALDFSVDNTDICAGDTVHFTDLSNNPNIDAYHYLSDGERLSHCAPNANPAWAFYETGTHDVTLEVIYNGCHSTTTQANLITVHGPVAKLHYDMTCESPFAYNFSSESEDADAVLWNFGDGSTSTDVTTTHTYANTGDYTVILKAINNTSGCPETFDTVTVYVRDIQADFALADHLCKGQDLNLNASNSQDVNAHCQKGYRWNSSTQRPWTLDEPEMPFPFTFLSSGDQWIELIVEDVNGCADTLRKYTRVFGVQTAFAPTDTLICLPNSIDFISVSTGDTTLSSWSWDFGDDATGSGPSPSHTYSLPSTGPFTVKLILKDIFQCTDTAVAVINTYQPFSVIAATPTTNICVGSTINFSASDYTAHQSFLNFNWNFGNGATSTSQSDVATYNTAGTYDVVLNFTEDSTGCPGQSTATVNVQDYPVAGFTSSVDDLDVLCHPLNVEFMDASTSNSPITHFWDFGNGSTGFQDNVFTVFTKGTFEISHVVSTSFGCTDTIIKFITTTGPEGDFTLDKTAICLGDEITATLSASDTVDVGSYIFDFGDGTQISNQSPATHSYTFLPGSNQQPIKLVLTSVDGNCEFTIEKIISLFDTQAEFAGENNSFTGCELEAFIFDNQSTDANQYHWDFGDGSTSNQENPTHVYMGAGTYTVTLTATNSVSNCEDEMTHEVTILPKTPVTASDVTMCVGDTTVLNVNNSQASYSYSWTPANYVGNPNNPTTTAFPPITTDFIVTADDGSGCLGMDTITVTVIQPFPAMAYDTIIFAGTTIQLPVQFGSPYIFSWNPETGLSCTNCAFPSITPEEEIAYTLSISDEANCFTSTNTYHIRIYNEDFKTPNAFTPNNDDYNDFFNIVLEDEVAAVLDITDFQIFDRWGQRVYNNDNPSKGWNGQFKGKDLPADVYPFFVEVTFINGKKKNIKGAVTLIR